ncbi:transient receptor potential channel pyrexia-like [Leptopilina boulardi]|uniref:transient receptor potential channel pyrexia-like n=1 Tax=Leptopilina boulardi TaxID=63433 RepID=UPI0021F5467F|nr:transient receptor potential channel pyrexia-like [Leptopilina boulardi]
MEFANYLQAEEDELMKLNNLQGISPISPRRPKSSLSINQQNYNNLSLLSPTYDTSRRHFSASFVYDQIKADEQLYDKLNKSYNSLKSPLNIYPESQEIKKSQETKINIEDTSSFIIDDSYIEKALNDLKNQEFEGLNLLNFIQQIINDDDLKKLLQMESGIIPEKNGIIFPDSDIEFKNRAFIWASFRGLLHLLPKLEASGADAHNTCFSGTSAMMTACYSGHKSCVQYLIERNVDLNYVNPIDGRNCLHFAVAGNSYETAKLLLDNGANLNYPGISKTNPLLHYAIKAKNESIVELFLERGADPAEKNSLGETPLHVACSVYSVNCCRMLMEKPQIDINAIDVMNRTPLHYATMSSWCDFRLIDILVKHGAHVNVIDKTGFSPLHIASLNEKSKCSETLIWNGADVSCTTSKGVSALNIILRKIPESFEVFRVKMDSSIKLKRPGCQNREIEMSLDFKTLLPSCNKKPETSVINTFIVENRKELLSHPLIRAFLYLKWKKIRRFYLFNIFQYTLTIIFMTAYILTALSFKCYNFTTENNKIDSHFICQHFSKWIIEFEWYMWLTLTCCILPRKLLTFSMNRCIKQCLWNLENFLDLIMISSVYITSFIYTGKNYDWQNYYGAFAILSAWTNLMLMIGQLPTFGTYVAMFTHIQYEFAKLLFAYSGLLLGFTLSFCVIYTREPSFRNPFTGLIKVLAMMAGELDFEGLISLSHLNDNFSNSFFHPLAICAQILFLIFIIFIVIILMNLLVGIAVHDIQGLRMHAGVTKLVRQTKLILYTEAVQCTIKFTPLFAILIPKHEMRSLYDIFVVKPLNPMEKSLPKDILKAAFEIARKRNPIMDDKSDRDGYKKDSWTEEGMEENLRSTLDSAVQKITLQMKTVTDEIHNVRDQFRDVKQILESIRLKLP